MACSLLIDWLALLFTARIRITRLASSRFGQALFSFPLLPFPLYDGQTGEATLGVASNFFWRQSALAPSSLPDPHDGGDFCEKNTFIPFFSFKFFDRSLIFHRRSDRGHCSMNSTKLVLFCYSDLVSSFISPLCIVFATLEWWLR